VFGACPDPAPAGEGSTLWLILTIRIKEKMKLNVLYAAAAIIIIAAAMKLAAPVVNIILVSILIAMTVMPLIIWLIKKGVPKVLSLLITLLVLIIVISFTAMMLSVAVVGIAEKIPQYEQNLESFKDRSIEFLSQFDIDVSSVFHDKFYSPEELVRFATEFISGLIEVFSNFAVVFLFVIFIIIDMADLRYRIHKGEKKIGKGLLKLAELADEIRRYMSISALTGLQTALGNLVLLLIVGVDFPVLWAFLSFLVSFIPNIGFILSVIPPAFLALAELGLTEAIIVIVGITIIHEIIENVIKPKYMGKELNLSLSMIFISLILWSWILGPIGAILAIPLTTSVMKAWEVLSDESLGKVKG
jgi:AI-2 transport protein TqsA